MADVWILFKYFDKFKNMSDGKSHQAKGGINAFYKSFIICVKSVLKSKNTELIST